MENYLEAKARLFDIADMQLLTQMKRLPERL
jgi:hypothetical protein